MKRLNNKGLKKLIPYIEESLGVQGKFIIKVNKICLKEDGNIVFTAHISDEILKEEEPVGVVTGTKPPPGSVDSGVGVDEKEVDLKELQKKVDDLSDFAEKVKERLNRGSSKDILKKALSDLGNAISI